MVLVSVRDNVPVAGAMVTPVVPLVQRYNRFTRVAAAGPADDGSMAPKFKVEVAELKVHFEVTEAFTVSVFEPAAAAMPEKQVSTASAMTLDGIEVSFMFGAETHYWLYWREVFHSPSFHPIQGLMLSVSTSL